MQYAVVKRPAERKRAAPEEDELRDHIKRELHAKRDPEDVAHFAGGVRGVSDQFVVLDSFEKIEGSSQPSGGVFAWAFMVQGVTRNQALGIRDRADNVIEVLVGSFAMPLLSDDPYIINSPPTLAGLPPLTANPSAPAVPADPLDSALSQLPFGHRMTAEIREINQAFSDRGGVRHQFEFKVAVAGNGLEATPLADFSRYMFTDPVPDISQITLVFRNPDYPVKFPADCLYGATLFSDGAQQVRVDFAGHGLVANDRIYFVGVVTPDSLLNSWFARREGLLVGPPVTADSFYLNPSVTTSIAATTAISSSKRVDVLIAKNRLRIPIRMRRVIQRATNYQVPVTV